MELFKAEMKYSSMIIHSNTFFGKNEFDGAFTREKTIIFLNKAFNKKKELSFLTFCIIFRIKSKRNINAAHIRFLFKQTKIY